MELVSPGRGPGLHQRAPPLDRDMSHCNLTGEMVVCSKCRAMHCKDCTHRGQVSSFSMSMYCVDHHGGSGWRIYAWLATIRATLRDWATELDTLGYDPDCYGGGLACGRLFPPGGRHPCHPRHSP